MHRARQGETFGSLAFDNGQKEWPVRAYKPGDWELHKPEDIGVPPVEFQYRPGYQADGHGDDGQADGHGDE